MICNWFLWLSNSQSFERNNKHSVMAMMETFFVWKCMLHIIPEDDGREGLPGISFDVNQYPSSIFLKMSLINQIGSGMLQIHNIDHTCNNVLGSK